MYHEASEVFYTNAFFNFFGDDFSKTLAILRLLPRKSLQRLRRIKFTMTIAQADGWGIGALACNDPKFFYGDIARYYWDNGERPQFDYQTGWRAIISFLANNADLPRLSVVVDTTECGWIFEERWMAGSELELDWGWFRFMYDFCIGLTTTTCSLKTLEAFHFDSFPRRL